MIIEAEWLALTASVPSATCRVYELTSRDLKTMLSTPGMAAQCTLSSALLTNYRKIPAGRTRGTSACQSSWHHGTSSKASSKHAASSSKGSWLADGPRGYRASYLQDRSVSTQALDNRLSISTTRLRFLKQRIPYPVCLPLDLASCAALARAREWIFCGFLITKPSLTSFLMFCPANNISVRTTEHTSIHEKCRPNLLSAPLTQIWWCIKLLRRKDKP